MIGLIQHMYDCAARGYQVTISSVPQSNHVAPLLISVTGKERSETKYIQKGDWDILEPFSVVDIINKMIEQIENTEEE